MSKKVVKSMDGIQKFVESISKKGSMYSAPILKKLMIPINGKVPELKVRGASFPWITPIGLTVIQDYRKPNSPQKVDTFWGDIILNLENKFKVDVAASKSGSVPNLVHSHDASHMMMTILELLNNDINNFSMVHDSFGCHAADADKLENIIMETFGDVYHTRKVEFIESALKMLNG